MRKRRRTEKEIQKIGAELRAGYVDGHPMAWFLQRSLPAINKLIHEELVTLRDIAKALTLVGLTYQTGNAWTERNLSRDLAKARQATRDQQSAVNGTLSQKIQITAVDDGGRPRTPAAKRWASGKAQPFKGKPAAKPSQYKSLPRSTTAPSDQAPRDPPDAIQSLAPIPTTVSRVNDLPLTTPPPPPPTQPTPPFRLPDFAPSGQVLSWPEHPGALRKARSRPGIPPDQWNNKSTINTTNNTEGEPKE